MRQLKFLMLFSYFLDTKPRYFAIRQKLAKYYEIRFKSISKKRIVSMIKQIADILDTMKIDYTEDELDYLMYGIIVQAEKEDAWKDIVDSLTKNLGYMSEERALEIVATADAIIDKIQD